jgi:protein TonB
MDFSRQEQSTSSKLMGIAVVVFIHALFIYILLMGLGKKMVAVMKEETPIETKIIEAVKPLLPPPPDTPAPPPKSIAPSLSSSPPKTQQAAHKPVLNMAPTVPNISAPHQDAPAPAPESAKPAPNVAKAQVDFSTCDKPEYPSSSLRNEEQGATRLSFAIAVDGQVVDAKIEKSSGFRALDMAAKKALSLCKFKPGTIDGQPQQSWAVVDYVWKLPD